VSLLKLRKKYIVSASKCIKNLLVAGLCPDQPLGSSQRCPHHQPGLKGREGRELDEGRGSGWDIR